MIRRWLAHFIVPALALSHRTLEAENVSLRLHRDQLILSSTSFDISTSMANDAVEKAQNDQHATREYFLSFAQDREMYVIDLEEYIKVLEGVIDDLS